MVMLLLLSGKETNDAGGIFRDYIETRGNRSKLSAARGSYANIKFDLNELKLA